MHKTAAVVDERIFVHRRQFRARRVSYVVVLALLCLSSVQASAAGNQPSAAAAPAAEQSALRWDGTSFTSVRAFKRDLVRRGVKWEPFLRSHPAVAKAFQLRPLTWGARSFYSREGMAGWLKRHGTTYKRWAAIHKAAARMLTSNATAQIGRPRRPWPLPRLFPPPPKTPPVVPAPATPPATPAPPTTPAPPPAPVTPAPPAPLPPSPDSKAIGIASGGSIAWYDDAKLAKELDGYATLGATWIRFDIAWSVAEPQRGVYDWAAYDRLVAKVRERGLNILAMVGYTPGWAQVAGATDDKYPPRNVADYANFAQKVVERYAPRGVKAYEIWNEPNLGCCFWKPKADAVKYTEMIRAAYPRMKAVDQSITVLTGGTSPADTTATDISPPKFLKDMYANGLKGNFDAVSHHPYYGPHPINSFKNWSSWSQMMLDTDRGRSLRGQMVDNGDGDKKIWASEANMLVQNQCIDGFCATEARQAAMIKEAVDAWRSYPWAGVLTMYNYYGHDGLSLVRGDWSPTPAWYALRDYR
jgi:hypothetical protein